MDENNTDFPQRQQRERPEDETREQRREWARKRLREMCPKERQFYEALAQTCRRIAATGQESAAKALPTEQAAGDDE